MPGVVHTLDDSFTILQQHTTHARMPHVNPLTPAWTLDAQDMREKHLNRSTVRHGHNMLEIVWERFEPVDDSLPELLVGFSTGSHVAKRICGPHGPFGLLSVLGRCATLENTEGELAESIVGLDDMMGERNARRLNGTHQRAAHNEIDVLELCGAFSEPSRLLAALFTKQSIALPLESPLNVPVCQTVPNQGNGASHAERYHVMPDEVIDVPSCPTGPLSCRWYRALMNPQPRTILVTGASKGIGLGIAQALVQAGHNVVLTSRSLEAANAAATTLNAMGPGQALGVQSDVKSEADQLRAVEQTLEAFGQLDVLVANAGIGAFKPIDELDPEQWHDVLDTNLTGVYYSVRAALEPLKASKGLIITIGSLAGANFFAGGAAYNASKFGLLGFSQAIMLDLRKYGVRVSTIMPGSVATYFNDHVPSDKDAWKIQPEDLAALVMDLMNMPVRTLPSRIEVRPSQPPSSS